MRMFENVASESDVRNHYYAAGDWQGLTLSCGGASWKGAHYGVSLQIQARFRSPLRGSWVSQSAADEESAEQISLGGKTNLQYGLRSNCERWILTKQSGRDLATDGATCVCGPRRLSTIGWVKYSDCRHGIMLTMSDIVLAVQDSQRECWQVKKRTFILKKESDIDRAELAHPFISHYITAAVATIKQSWQASLTGPSNQKWAPISGGVSRMDLLWFPAEYLTFCKNIFPGGFGLYFKAAITRKMGK